MDLFEYEHYADAVSQLGHFLDEIYMRYPHALPVGIQERIKQAIWSRLFSRLGPITFYLLPCLKLLAEILEEMTQRNFSPL